MKKINTIAAALTALAIGAPNVNCTGTYSPRPEIIERYESTIIQDLDEIIRSVYCVRTEAEYAKDGDIANGTRTATGTGTAFAYINLDGYNYLVTNQHVTDFPETIIDMHLVQGVTGLELATDTYVKIRETTSIVTNTNDTDPSDDIQLEEVAKNTDLDIAILRTDTDIFIANSYHVDFSLRPAAGESAYIIGYPQGMFSAVTNGIVAHPDYSTESGEHLDVIDATATFGNSGSPYFIQRDGRLHWGGIMGKIAPYRGSNTTMFTLGSPLREIQCLIDLSCIQNNNATYQNKQDD